MLLILFPGEQSRRAAALSIGAGVCKKGWCRMSGRRHRDEKSRQEAAGQPLSPRRAKTCLARKGNIHPLPPRGFPP
jgi:hypothetical protein